MSGYHGPLELDWIRRGVARIGEVEGKRARTPASFRGGVAPSCCRGRPCGHSNLVRLSDPSSESCLRSAVNAPLGASRREGRWGRARLRPAPSRAEKGGAPARKRRSSRARRARLVPCRQAETRAGTDHPVRRGFPEGDYLQALSARIMSCGQAPSKEVRLLRCWVCLVYPRCASD